MPPHDPNPLDYRTPDPAPRTVPYFFGGLIAGSLASFLFWWGGFVIPFLPMLAFFVLFPVKYFVARKAGWSQGATAEERALAAGILTSIATGALIGMSACMFALTHGS